MIRLNHTESMRSILILAALLLTSLAALARDSEAQAMMQEAQRIIAAYHAGQPQSHGTLRVVYFVPNDREPLPGYRGAA